MVEKACVALNPSEEDGNPKVVVPDGGGAGPSIPSPNAGRGPNNSSMLLLCATTVCGVVVVVVLPVVLPLL
jgi:hypothetical protein